MVVKLFNNKPDKPKKRKGYGFENPEECGNCIAVRSAENADGIILGQDGADNNRLIDLFVDNGQQNRNIAVIGTPDTGKSYSFSYLYCYQAVKRHENMFITDADGSLYRDMAGYFESNGYTVKCLNFTDISVSDGYDLMQIINDNDSIFAVYMLARDIVESFRISPNSKDAAVALLSSLILRIYLDPNRSAERKNIGEVYDLLQNAMDEENLDSLFEETLISDDLKPCISMYHRYKEYENEMIDVLVNGLQLLNDQNVRKIVSDSSVNIEEFCNSPYVCFCVLPEDQRQYASIASLLITQMYRAIANYANSKCNRILPTPIDFLMENFDCFGFIPDIDKYPATGEKNGFKFALLAKNTENIRTTYREATNSILDNCATWITLDTNTDEALNLVAFRTIAGEYSIRKRQNPFADYVKNTLTLSNDDLFIVLPDKTPLLAKTYPYTLHPEYSAMCAHISPAEGF